MTILGLICTIHGVRSCYSTVSMPWHVLREIQGITVDTILVLKIEEQSVNKFISIDKLLAKYPSLQTTVNNWDDILEFITSLEDIEDLVEKTLVPTRYIHSIDDLINSVTPFFSTIRGELGYVSLHTANTAITEEGRDIVISNFGHISDNAIFFINGVACYAEYVDNKIVLKNGALLKISEDFDIRNIIALDFSRVGTIIKYKLSECSKVYVTGLEHKLYSITDIEHPIRETLSFKSYINQNISMCFTLPDDIEGVPVLCIAGRLFFPQLDKLSLYQINNRKAVIFTVSRDILERMISVNVGMLNPSINRVSSHQINISEFIENLFVSDNPNYMDATTPFIMILKSKHKLHLQKTDSIMQIGKDMLRFPKNSNGMLINKYTRELVDHVKLRYNEDVIVTISDRYKSYIDIKNAPASLTTNRTGWHYANYNESDNHNPYSYKSDLTSPKDLVLLDIGWDIPDEKTLPIVVPEEEEFDLKLCGRFKRITLNPVVKQISQEPVNILMLKVGDHLQIFKENDNISHIQYTFMGGLGNHRTWIKMTQPKYTIKYNEGMQCWVFVDDNDNVKYYSSLSATKTITPATQYYDPWSNNLLWYKMMQ